MNAICYGYYTVIIVITATYEIPLALKIVAVAIVNFIGVFTIKFCEEKIPVQPVIVAACGDLAFLRVCIIKIFVYNPLLLRQKPCILFRVENW